MIIARDILNRNAQFVLKKFQVQTLPKQKDFRAAIHST
jgi:hypothetical protein